MASFIPLIIISAIFAVFAYPIAKRKGLGVGSVALCIIPFVGQFALLWLVSKTDQDVLDRIRRLEEINNTTSIT